MLKIFFPLLLVLFSNVAESAQISVHDSKIAETCSSSTIHFIGEIASNDAAVLESHLSQLESRFGVDNCRSGFTAIKLHSNGGDATEALKIGRVIRRHNLQVILAVGNECLSSCVFLIAGGVRRIIIGRVGVHRPYFGTLSSKLSTDDIKKKRAEFNRQVRDFIDEMDVSQNLLDVMLSVPPETIRYLTDDELQRFRLSEDDATWDEKQVAMKAEIYKLSSAEFRRRNAVYVERCLPLFANRNNPFGEFEICRDSVFFWVKS